MKKLIAAATLAALIPALVDTASAHRPTLTDSPAPVRLDSKAFFDKLQREGR